MKVFKKSNSSSGISMLYLGVPQNSVILDNTLNWFTQGLMCNKTGRTCTPRPEPCPQLPSVAGPDRCYCHLSNKLCDEGFSCGGEKNTCFEPTVCEEGFVNAN